MIFKNTPFAVLSLSSSFLATVLTAVRVMGFLRGTLPAGFFFLFAGPFFFFFCFSQTLDFFCGVSGEFCIEGNL